MPAMKLYILILFLHPNLLSTYSDFTALSDEVKMCNFFFPDGWNVYLRTMCSKPTRRLPFMLFEIFFYEPTRSPFLLTRVL